MVGHSPANSDGPIHTWFGLSYAAYFVMPRLAMQEMPIEWQNRFIALMEELHAAIGDTPGYVVQRRGARGRYVDDPWGAYRRGTVEQAKGAT